MHMRICMLHVHVHARLRHAHRCWLWPALHFTPSQTRVPASRPSAPAKFACPRVVLVRSCPPHMREAALRTLRLSRGADDAAVRAAYLRLAKEYHPDVSTEHTGGEAFKRISEAAEFLLSGGSAARDMRAAETVGPAIRARWNIRRRHQPSEYPAWFKPSAPEPNSRGLHTRASFVSLVPRVLLSALQWPLSRGILGGTRHARGTARSPAGRSCRSFR